MIRKVTLGTLIGSGLGFLTGLLVTAFFLMVTLGGVANNVAQLHAVNLSFTASVLSCLALRIIGGELSYFLLLGGVKAGRRV